MTAGSCSAFELYHPRWQQDSNLQHDNRPSPAHPNLLLFTCRLEPRTRRTRRPPNNRGRHHSCPPPYRLSCGKWGDRTRTRHLASTGPRSAAPGSMPARTPSRDPADQSPVIMQSGDDHANREQAGTGLRRAVQACPPGADGRRSPLDPLDRERYPGNRGVPNPLERISLPSPSSDPPDRTRAPRPRRMRAARTTFPDCMIVPGLHDHEGAGTARAGCGYRTPGSTDEQPARSNC